jgi:uracil-DNA glycosylase
MIAVRLEAEFSAWRQEARRLLAQRIPPESIDWIEGAAENSLFAEPLLESATSPVPHVPGQFLRLAETVAAHRHPLRWALLYRLLWRMTMGGVRNLLARATDPDVHQAQQWAKAIGRDIHKMHAFVRFRLVGHDASTGREQFVAWFEPEHRIVQLATPFFVRRFAGMDWSILTPDGCAHWCDGVLEYSPGLNKDAAPQEDALDDLWRTYYANIFNPARIKVKAMQSEMPKKYWKNLPEAELIARLIAGGTDRMEGMLAEPERPVRPVPNNAYVQKLQARDTWLETIPQDLAEVQLASLAKSCRACPLAERATQTVFGLGPMPAPWMVIGEQPDEPDDLTGKLFTGRTGNFLREVLRMEEIELSSVYFTTAVKHFAWESGDRQRIAISPAAESFHACRPWLMEEWRRVRPQVILLLGKLTAESVLQRQVDFAKERGRIEAPAWAPLVWLLDDPQDLLRMTSRKEQVPAMWAFLEEVQKVRKLYSALELGQAGVVK